MISRERFERIKRLHGQYASWAVWADVGVRPKDNIADLSVLDPNRNSTLLQSLNPEFVFIGLNISRRVEDTFGNFHDARSMATDFKIRAALKSTRFWGGYMTDIIKDFEQKASGKMMQFLTLNPDFERQNIELFRNEIADLGVDRPLLIAFGKDAAKVVRRNLGGEFRIVEIPHYAKYVSQSKYHAEVDAVLAGLEM